LRLLGVSTSLSGRRLLPVRSRASMPGDEADDALRQEQRDATNSPPSANSQNSGRAAVNQLLAPLTATAPMTAPTSVPRPPTATQITTSMELAGANSPGLMMPTCGT
jgi:hypothetical protein